MDRRPSSFEYRDKCYKAESKWTISQSTRPAKLIFSTPKQECHKSFILSKNEGMSICEDFQNSDTLSELQTENLNMLCLDYSGSIEQQVVIGFTTGHILVMDPTKRKRGKVTWLNTRKNIYSNSPPKVCRWLDENTYVVLFGDSHFWKFDKRLTGEDIDFIRAAPNTARDSTEAVIFFDHPYPKANPVSFWKVNLGVIRDMQVSPKSRGLLIAAITDQDVKIIDMVSHCLVKVLKSYFAGFQALAWSSDGDLIVAGGEDDCVHVWNTRNWKLLAKGVGHTSWVSSVCLFYKHACNVVISAGQDGKLILWEIEEDGGKERDTGELVVEYKRDVCVIEPCVEVRISDEPLHIVTMHGENLFVLDLQGNLNMWS